MQQKRAYLYRCYPTPSQRQMLARTDLLRAFRLQLGPASAHGRLPRARGTRLLSRHQRGADPAQTAASVCWLNEVSSVPPQQALRHLDKAFRNFFDGRARYPTFKKKRGRQSAEYTTSAFTWDGSALTLARMPEPLPIRWSRPCPRMPSRAPSRSVGIPLAATLSPSWCRRTSLPCPACPRR